MTTSSKDVSLSNSNNKEENERECAEAIESRRVEIIRDFFDDKSKHLKKDKLSQFYLSIKFTSSDLEKIAQRFSDGNVIDNKLSIDDLKTMFQAYCMESSNTNKGFVLLGFVSTALIAPMIVLFFQQSILESSGAIKPEDRTVVTECKRQLDSKGYVELESLCSPLKNRFFKEADTQTYNAIGKIIRGENWDSKKGYRGKDIANNKEAMCPKLREIDLLWKNASGGKLGFNVQRKIWNKNKSYPAFTKSIGWKNPLDDNWTTPSYDLAKIKDGHLPALWNQTHKDPIVGDASGETDYKIFFDFIESCEFEKLEEGK
jgi:GUN4-like